MFRIFQTSSRCVSHATRVAGKRRPTSQKARLERLVKPSPWLKTELFENYDMDLVRSLDNASWQIELSKNNNENNNTTKLVGICLTIDKWGVSRIVKEGLAEFKYKSQFKHSKDSMRIDLGVSDARFAEFDLD